MIQYPRKCPDCKYIANNPAMFSYHRKTHAPIPAGILCHFGCRQLATVMNTGGKYTCKEKYHECLAYLDQLAERTRQSWINDVNRKEETKQSLIERLHNEETYRKQSRTKRTKFGTLDPERAKEYRRYARFIRQRAQQWAKEQGYVLGQQTYHVDHKLSILDAWKAGLSEEVVNHPANLQIIEAKSNTSKGSRSTLTIEELLMLSNLTD